MATKATTDIDVEAERAWLLEHKEQIGLGWNPLGTKIGVPGGTLSQFGPGTYNGDNARIAEAVARYRQHLIEQAAIDLEAPEVPHYFETTTSRQIVSILGWTQRGRISLIVTGPGVGKTKSAEHYAEGHPNVWRVTMRPSTAGVNNMQMEILAALGDRDAKGTPQSLTRQIIERVANRNGLIIFDEAQHLSEKSVEEARSIHDACGVGLAFFGNETVISRFEGGARRAAYAQLYSRVGMRLIRPLPLREDARALAEAWGIEEPKLVAYIVQQSQKPGGLRTVTFMIETASMIAAADGQKLSLSHLSDAWAQLTSRPIAA